MGSMHEVGFYEGSIDENTPCHPLTPYGVAKNALRDLTKAYADNKGVEWQWIRAFYIVGNQSDGCSVFSQIVKAVERQQTSFPITEGNNQYDFIDYDEFCEKFVSCVLHNSHNGIINVCSGYPEKLRNRIEKFVSENQYKIKLEIGAFPDRPYDSKAIWGNSMIIDNIMKERKYERKLVEKGIILKS